MKLKLDCREVWFFRSQHNTSFTSLPVREFWMLTCCLDVYLWGVVRVVKSSLFVHDDARYWSKLVRSGGQWFPFFFFSYLSPKLLFLKVYVLLISCFPCFPCLHSVRWSDFSPAEDLLFLPHTLRPGSCHVSSSSALSYQSLLFWCDHSVLFEKWRETDGPSMYSKQGRFLYATADQSSQR